MASFDAFLIGGILSGLLGLCLGLEAKFSGLDLGLEASGLGLGLEAVAGLGLGL